MSTRVTERPPRGGRSHGKRKAGMDARDLLAEMGKELAPGGRHRLIPGDDSPTAEIPNVAVIISLASELNGLGGVEAVLVDRAPNGPCGWCQMEGHEKTVTVYGDPDPTDLEHPLDVEEVCRDCAPKTVQQARIEQRHDSRKNIVVEIGVNPR